MLWVRKQIQRDEFIYWKKPLLLEWVFRCRCHTGTALGLRPQQWAWQMCFLPRVAPSPRQTEQARRLLIWQSFINRALTPEQVLRFHLHQVPWSQAAAAEWNTSSHFWLLPRGRSSVNTTVLDLMLRHFLCPKQEWVAWVWKDSWTNTFSVLQSLPFLSLLFSQEVGWFQAVWRRQLSGEQGQKEASSGSAIH